MDNHIQEKRCSASGKEKSIVKRLLELISVCIFLYSFYLGPVVGPILTLYLLFYTKLWLPVLAYLGWIYLDRNTPYEGGRSSEVVRGLWLWHHFRDYFPQKMIKTVDLDPSNNYLLCLFPHGILTTAAISHLFNQTSQAPSLFPGFTFSGFTLNINFYIPFFRELVMGYGLSSVSKGSMLYQMNRGPGRIYFMFPGGSAEAAKSQPGTYRLALKNRKGFVRLALATGTHLVPVVAFGETNVMDQWVPEKGTLIKKFQEVFRRCTGAAPCVCLSLLPQRTPVTAVVGEPVMVKRVENPSSEDVDRVHAEFISRLIDLFERHKAQYLDQPNSVHLIIED